MDSLIEAPSFPPRSEVLDLKAANRQATERQAATPYEPFLQDWYPAPARGTTREA